MEMELKDRYVHVVDDDPLMRSLLLDSLESRGMAVKAFDSAETFLDGADTRHGGCLLLDLELSGMGGLNLQSELNNRGISLPIIYITGCGDIPSTVEVLKAGTFDFLEKPCKQEVLFQRIDDALEEDFTVRSTINKNQSRFARLTEREHEILMLLVSGSVDLSNKEIARKLDISHRTVEQLRARIMEKTQAQSITELAKLAKLVGLRHTKTELH